MASGDKVFAFPLGKIWKALLHNKTGYTITRNPDYGKPGERAVVLKDANGNVYAPPNWLESMNITISAFNLPGVSDTEITNLLHNVSDRMDNALLAYAGKDLQSIPDNINVTIGAAEYPAKWEPFGTLIPGVDNPGVDPSTGQTPIDSTIGVANSLAQIAASFAALVSPAGLALLGGAILLLIGLKMLTNANVPVVPVV